MDEEELMYRFMNEEDDLYMGDRDDEESEDYEKSSSSGNGNNGYRFTDLLG